jgi:hypothetical protein
MGYYVDTLDFNVGITKDKFDKAIESLNSLMTRVDECGRGGQFKDGEKVKTWYAWVTTQTVVDALKAKDKAQALIKAFVEWGYEFEKTTDGIELVCREMSKWGDDEHLWSAVAPVLDHNHYIKWRGEDDCYWQYKFANGTLNEGSGQLMWEE